MKLTAALIAWTFASLAWSSCPQLQASYNCESLEDGSTYESVITQRDVNGVTVYTIKDSDDTEAEELYTDAKERTMSIGDQSIITKAYCKDNKVIQELRFEAPNGRFKVVVAASKNVDKVLKIHSKAFHNGDLIEEGLQEVCTEK